MAGCDAESALPGFRREFKKVPPDLRQTLTYDRDSEMALHEKSAKQLSIQIYFANPYTPWQRSSNESTNGPLRQYLPKGTDLSVYSQHQLAEIARRLNTRPRATLNFLIPIEAYQAELDKLNQNVALHVCDQASIKHLLEEQCPLFEKSFKSGLVQHG